jgi:hypothetical protein
MPLSQTQFAIGLLDIKAALNDLEQLALVIRHLNPTDGEIQLDMDYVQDDIDRQRSETDALLSVAFSTN